MADYYSLTMASIQNVQAKVQGELNASILQLNKRQCEYVAQQLLKVSQLLQAQGAENLNKQGCLYRIVLLHLHATVKRAQILVDTCCCENSSWLAAAMALGDTKEEVMAILLDLHQWTFLIDIAICASAGAAQESQSQLWEIGEEGYQRLLKPRSKMHTMIQDAARQDQEDLLEKITSSLKLEDQHGADYIRGVYLKSRLHHMEGDLEGLDELKAYRISRDLGSGASGMVLEIEWLEQDLALKILKVIDRTESTVLGRLQHPNIVRLYHYWEDLTPYPRSCIVMELMPTDLQKHIVNVMGKQSKLPLKSKKGASVCMPFSLSVVIDIMLQVAEAMRQLHENKLTHRDLKTSNVLVKPVSERYMELHTEGYLEVKLADFGSAKAYANSSISGDLTRNTGTTAYGAPEIFEKEITERERNFPPKADVWSFGMTCSEVVTGRVPFADDTGARSTLHKRIIKNGLRPSIPEECPEYLQFCIKCCWELQPQRRPSFSDLCRMLRHAKLLSLGLMDMETSKSLFAYQTSAGVLKSGGNSVLQKKEPKMSRFGFNSIRRNLREAEGSALAAMSQQISLLSDPHNQLREHHAEGARPGSTAIDRSSQEIGRMVLNLLGRSLQEP
ncbi:hypothetical protein M758_3G077300 [Ceratodon purpureus]|nr:hypothetical protein M758_3G077300 [Ceratodon purpureus]